MHESFSLEQAADFLNMSAEHLRRETKAGNIPGLKPEKEWLFIQEDLVKYIRSQHSEHWQISYATDSNEEESIKCVKEKISGTQISQRQMANEYEYLLRQ
jgi:Helix-turn-helix domain